MPSHLVVEVKAIDEIREHPNADSLEFAIMGGWQCIIKKGQYKAGDKIIYFPPDTLIPMEWCEKFGVVKYVVTSDRYPGKGRIRLAKLRGLPSFGLITPIPDESWEIGRDVIEYYNAEKYDPPPARCSGEAAPDNHLFPRYTDIDNLRHYPKILVEGEEVVATEKIHGSNCRVGIIHNIDSTIEEMAGSHRFPRKRPEDLTSNQYWFPWTIPGVASLLRSLSEYSKNVILFGEIYGCGVQSLQYDHKRDLGFRAFDLYMDGIYFDHDKFVEICEQHGVQMVPVLYRGPYSLDKIKEVAEGQSTLAEHMREGTVVRPVKEREGGYGKNYGRIIFKYISDAYLAGKHANEEVKDE